MALASFKKTSDHIKAWLEKYRIIIVDESILEEVMNYVVVSLNAF